MLSDHIYINGQLTASASELPEFRRLVQNNYVYASVNTAEHRTLYLKRQLHYASRSYRQLYGVEVLPDIGKTDRLITDLLHRNRAPKFGNLVNIFFLPHYGGNREKQPDIIISVDKPTVYKGYELLSLRPRAVLTNYEIPFSEHRTGVSLTTSAYMDEFASRSGAHIALRANRMGNLISAGDYPVFCVKGGKIFTPEPSRGVGNSVERELMMLACKYAGIEVIEEDITVDSLADSDELMVFNCSGIQSVLSCGNEHFYNLTAIKLESYLSVLTRDGLFSSGSF